MPRPDHPHEVRVQMAVDAALERTGADRDAFIAWLKAADPRLAAHVLIALADREEPGSPSDG